MLLAVLCLIYEQQALAQGLARLLPEAPAASDVNEVEDIPGDEDSLLGSDTAPETAEVRRHQDEIKLTQARELSLSDREIRSRFNYGMALAYGPTRPWQNYSLEGFTMPDARYASGLYAGVGTLKQPGIGQEKAYDIDLTSRSAGVFARYFFSRLEGLYIEGEGGYAVWSGRMTPHGSDIQDPQMQEKLTDSFDMSGMVIGAAAALHWVWENGLLVEWTMIGMRRSWVLQKQLGRGSATVERIVTRDIQRAEFFGLTNIKIGYMF